MNKPNFEFAEYKVPEGMEDVDQLGERGGKLVDDLIAFVASYIGEPAPARSDLLSNQTKLSQYLERYSALVAAGTIVETDESVHLPCGETPDQVMRKLKGRITQGLDGKLLSTPGAEGLDVRVIEALKVLPEATLSIVLAKGEPGKYTPELLVAIKRLSAAKLKIIGASLTRTVVKLHEAHPVVISAIAGLSDEVMEDMGLTWYTTLQNQKKAAVIEELGKGSIPHDMLAVIDFNCVDDAEMIKRIANGMTPRKWQRAREASSNANRGIINHWVIEGIALLTEDQLGAINDLSWIFDKYEYGKIFKALAASQFPADRIKLIGGHSLRIMQNLTDRLDGDPPSLVEELGRLTDEDIDAYGGLDHILDLALGSPLTERERTALITACDQTAQLSAVTDLKRAIEHHPPGARIGDNLVLLEILNNAFNPWNLGMFTTNGELYPHRGRIRLSQFCAAILPSASSVRVQLAQDRHQKGLRKRLDIKMDRSVMDPESPNYCEVIYDCLIRTPVIARFGLDSNQEIDQNTINFCRNYPVVRDGLLRRITDQQFRTLISVQSERFLLSEAGFSDQFILDVLNQPELGRFIQWFYQKWSLDYQGSQDVGEAASAQNAVALFELFQAETRREAIAGRPKIEMF